MQSPQHPLPRLDRLVAFEAAARLGSFTKAGEELHRTQSAISHAVKALEADLGVALFRRLHRAIQLTPEGMALHNSVGTALNHLSAAASTLHAERGRTWLRLNTDTAIAYHWLLPRLDALKSALPDMALDLSVTDDITLLQKADLAIVHGNGDWPGRTATLLFEDEIFPVCATGYLARNGPIRSIDDLTTCDLIDLKYERWSWANWNIWLTEMGHAQRALQVSMQSDLYSATIKAALAGQGVALAWRRLVDEQLLSGALVRPLEADLRTGLGYYLIASPQMTALPQTEALCAWLLREIDRQRLFGRD